MGNAEVLVVVTLVVTREVPRQISSHPSCSTFHLHAFIICFSQLCRVLLVEDPLSVVVAEAIVQVHLVQVLLEDYTSFGLLVLKHSIQNLRILI
ncbi:hypothetical protein Golob_015699 [Gossypium lobatum]|uniref:Uncharacterized protein n=1 Tax=Gossypium lobatum TaxID=34289 RepID=A0A7J8M2E3_9ROSI|nr:hypothetical protein [Gossypium lobatum]